MALARFVQKSFAATRLYNNRFALRSSLLFHRGFSATPDFDISTDDSSGVAILRMQKKPANSFSLQTLTDLCIALDKLENDDKCNGLIITSVIPKIFGAGMDLSELYQPKRENLKELWRALHDFWLKLYGSRLVTIAAMNGHAIAGGCLIAVSCDYRIMASGPYKIGLSEVLLGIQAPLWLIDSMVNVVGQRIAERGLKLGELYLPDEALKIGLVDEVVDGSDVLETARREIVKWLRVPGHARQLTKAALRKPTIDRMVARYNESLDKVTNLVYEDATQQILGDYINSLKKK